MKRLKKLGNALLLSLRIKFCNYQRPRTTKFVKIVVPFLDVFFSILSGLEFRALIENLRSKLNR
jgi:hypothetical protein